MHGVFAGENERICEDLKDFSCAFRFRVLCFSHALRYQFQNLSPTLRARLFPPDIGND